MPGVDASVQSGGACPVLCLAYAWVRQFANVVFRQCAIPAVSRLVSVALVCCRAVPRMKVVGKAFCVFS